jgi:hypothetical protein
MELSLSVPVPLYFISYNVKFYMSGIALNFMQAKFTDQKHEFRSISKEPIMFYSQSFWIAQFPGATLKTDSAHGTIRTFSGILI